MPLQRMGEHSPLKNKFDVAKIQTFFLCAQEIGAKFT